MLWQFWAKVQSVDGDSVTAAVGIPFESLSFTSPDGDPFASQRFRPKELIRFPREAIHSVWYTSSSSASAPLPPTLDSRSAAL